MPPGFKRLSTTPTANSLMTDNGLRGEAGSTFGEFEERCEGVFQQNAKTAAGAVALRDARASE